jgi:hypothetical protein
MRPSTPDLSLDVLTDEQLFAKLHPDLRATFIRLSAKGNWSQELCAKVRATLPDSEPLARELYMLRLGHKG